MRLKLAVPIAVAVVSVGVVSCSIDAPSPTTPTQHAVGPSTGARLLQSPINVVPLQRTTPLDAAQSASARIGILGGQLSLPAAGLIIIVPPLAVVTPVTMTVTAPAGSDVAYELAPHGLSFLTPLIATQDLRNTDARAGGLIDPFTLYLGYFPDSSHITTVTELLDLRVDLLAQTSTALLWHFSGYIWSSGRESDEIGATESITSPRAAARLR